ncbi:MAG: hypothetical protein PVI13_08645 [Desulfobacterales bacterium]|jgi:hypothetical protein
MQINGPLRGLSDGVTLNGEPLTCEPLPYCITHFEESRIALTDNAATDIKDITEIIQKVI